MNFQIAVNVAAPNSVHNTCVFCCFEAGDTVTNLHIALDHCKDQVAHLQGMELRYEQLSRVCNLFHKSKSIISTMKKSPIDFSG